MKVSENVSTQFAKGTNLPTAMSFYANSCQLEWAGWATMLKFKIYLWDSNLRVHITGQKQTRQNILCLIAYMNYDLLLNCLHTAVNSQTVLHSILWICAFFTNLMVISHLHSYFSTGQICGVLVWECVGSNIQLKHVHFNFFTQF